jgi:hypothetical protein
MSVTLLNSKSGWLFIIGFVFLKTLSCFKLLKSCPCISSLDQASVALIREYNLSSSSFEKVRLFLFDLKNLVLS